MLMANRALVLGAAGFIGSELCQRLVAEGKEVVAFDRSFPLNFINDHPGCMQVVGEFSDCSKLKVAVKGCDQVYHLLSTSIPAASNNSPRIDCEENVVGTLQFLDIAVEYQVERVIFVSSGGTVYGKQSHIPVTEDAETNPICAYGVAKLAIEKYLEVYRHLFGLDYRILRVANPYGERQPINRGQGVISVFIDKAIRGDSISIWGDGSTIRDFIHLQDVIDALVLTSQHRGLERVFNIGSGEGTSLNEVVDVIGHVLNRSLKIDYQSGRSIDVPINILDISRAVNYLGWSPKITFSEGIKRVVSFRKHTLEVS